MNCMDYFKKKYILFDLQSNNMLISINTEKNMENSYATFMYNKAIDDFFKNIKECSGWTPNCIESWHDVCLTIYTLYLIAEELKKDGAE